MGTSYTPHKSNVRAGNVNAPAVAHIFEALTPKGVDPNDNFGVGIAFDAPNDAEQVIRYADMLVYANDVSDGTEDAHIVTRVQVAGTLTEVQDITSAGFGYPDNVALFLGTADDVKLVWDGTNFLVTPVADDTGAFRVGNGTLDMDFRVTLGAAGDYVEMDVGAKALEVVGDARIDLSAATIAAANTDGGLIKAGTSGARVVEDTASMKFMSFYFDDGATSGTSVGVYDRLYVTGAGGSGQALRSFVTVEDVAAGNAYGAHISASFGATGSITGLGNALATTLHVPGAMSGGTYASQTVEIWADAATSDLAGATSKAFQRVGIGGDATGIALIDDTINYLDFYGVSAGSGNMIDTDITTHTAYGGLRVVIPGVGVRWIALVSA